MAKITLKKSGDEIQKLLHNLSQAGTAAGKVATYAGADVIADAIRRQIEILPEDKFRYLNKGDEFNVITPQNKEDLLNSLGIDKIRKDEDGVRTVIGFAGYNDHPKRKYPKGLPMRMLAGSIENGSSVRRACPFVKPATGAKRGAAKKAMAQAGNEFLKTIE